MMAIRLAEAGGGLDRDRLESELFSDRYLIHRARTVPSSGMVTWKSERISSR
jgi:hypothetical protein